MLDRAARYYGDDFVADSGRLGVFGRALAVVGRNPGRTLAIGVMVAGTAAIVANAAFWQSADHPSPLFATRTATAAAETPAAAAADVPTPAANPERIDEVGRLVQLTMAETPRVDATPASASVVEAQQLLTALGYQPGTVDGLFGTRTRRAIEAFQQERGLPVAGVVTSDLLTQLRAASPTTVANAGAPAAPAATGGQPSALATILAVQTALNQSGYGPVTADGTIDGTTATAIRQFQLDNGLSLTGQVDDALIARMTAIGALAL